MNNKFESYKAEETFLKYFCDIKSFDWGTFYIWDKGANWPKFNFVRLYEKPNQEELLDIIDSNKKMGIPTFLKIDNSININEFLPYLNCELGGVPIVHLLSSDPFNFSIDENSLSVLKVSSSDMLRKWWLINSSGREREDVFNSPIYINLEKMLPNESFYILSMNGQYIGCFATSNMSGNDINLWGVAINKEYQGQGLVKFIYNWLSQKEKNRIFGQVNIDSATHFLRKKNSSTIIGTIENRYEVIY